MHDKAVALDGHGYFNRMTSAAAKRLLRIPDWMEVPIESADISIGASQRSP
jgi:hypothetical protein